MMSPCLLVQCKLWIVNISQDIHFLQEILVNILHYRRHQLILNEQDHGVSLLHFRFVRLMLILIPLVLLLVEAKFPTYCHPLRIIPTIDYF